MAENDENPRKKQKLDEFPVQSNTLQADIHSLKERDEKVIFAVDKKEDKNSPHSINIESELDQPGVSQTLEVVEGPISSQNDESSWETDSEASAMSPFSGEDMWKGDTEPLSWVYHMMSNGENPRTVLQEIMPNGVPDLDDFSLWRLLLTIVSEPPPREKLLTVNTISDVIHLIQRCQNIIVLTGAGVSVSCGIPDFRSRNGIYARLAVDFPDLPDPQAMFDIRYFRNDQRPFFKFAKEIYPGQFEPSKCHRFIRLIEEHGKLLRNYTQNIDTLEQVAGIRNVIQCHGSFATATCMACKYKCSSDDIKQDIMDQVIPKCSKCDPPTDLSIMKPDIVFFGESLPEEFHRQMAADKEKCDLLIVIGSSLKVRPVALIPNSLPAHVPQILINKEYLRALNFDVELLGDCEIIISELCRQLGDKWESLANKDNPLTEIRTGDLVTPPETPIDVGGDNIDSKSVDISLKSQGLENTIDNKTKTTQKTSKNVHDNVESNEHVAGNIEVILMQNDSNVTSSSVEHFESDGISEKDQELDQEPSSCKTDQNGSEAPIWVPSKWRVSERLGPGQYCFMPPNRYIFKDAEVFIADSDSSDETDDSDSHNDEDDKTEMKTAEERHVVNESQENSVALATQTEENIKQDEVAGNKNDSRCEVLELDAFSNTVDEFQEQKKEEITTQNSKLHVEELSN